MHAHQGERHKALGELSRSKFFFLTKNARDLLHSTVPSIVLKGKLCLGSTGFSSMLHHELPLAKLYHHRAVRAAATVAIFQTTFPPSIHLSPAYGKLEIPGEGCSLCLWCGNDMEVQPLGATAATLLLQKIVLTLQILSNLWQEGNISEARSGLQMASWDITGACCLLSQNLCQPCTLSLQH